MARLIFGLVLLVVASVFAVDEVSDSEILGAMERAIEDDGPIVTDDSFSCVDFDSEEAECEGCVASCMTQADPDCVANCMDVVYQDIKYAGDINEDIDNLDNGIFGARLVRSTRGNRNMRRYTFRVRNDARRIVRSAADVRRIVRSPADVRRIVRSSADVRRIIRGNRDVRRDVRSDVRRMVRSRV